MKLLKNRMVKFLIVPIVLFLFLTLNYRNYQKTLPITYWDEVLWVGRSYFFDFFINGDFDNDIWKTNEAYDQPKLGEFVYGAWLYPSYLREKNISSDSFDYIKFLIKNGFYEIDESGTTAYKDYKNKSKLITFDQNTSGFQKDWETKYGQKGLKTTDLIYKARILNIFLLAGAIIWGYFLVLEFGGVILATFFSVLYGLNPLIMNTGLKAHSEALFLFTFNAALFFMNIYFVKKRKLFYLILFSIFTGLCVSTKLSGLMLLVIFFALNFIFLFILKKEKIKYLLLSLFPTILILIVFIILNPFIYANHANMTKNIKFMVTDRKNTIEFQTKRFSDAYIPKGIPALKKTFEHFYLSNSSSYNAGINILNILFLIAGLGYLTKQVIKKNIMAVIILTSLTVIIGFMSWYLVLDWERYFVTLPLFLITIQLLGLFWIIRSIKYLLKK